MFLGLVPHYEAIQTIMAAVKMGEGVIKVTGEVGTGKTMVCRKLIEQVESEVELVYLPNPVLNGEQLQFAVAQELGIEDTDPLKVVSLIQERLIQIHSLGKKTVLIVDDILDTGRTLAFETDLMTARGAEAVHTCVLLDKHEKREVPLDANYAGFPVDDIFVVGYGIDMAHLFRSLPFIGVVRQD